MLPTSFTYDVPGFGNEPFQVDLRERHIQTVYELKQMLKPLVCLCFRIRKRYDSSEQIAQLACVGKPGSNQHLKSEKCKKK
jgi:hypothetical protein